MSSLRPIIAVIISSYSLSLRLPPELLKLDFDIDPGGEVQFHKGVDRLLGRIQNVDQTLVDSYLELLSRLLVDVRRTRTVYRLIFVGSGIGPATRAPVFFAVTTISLVD